MISRFMRIFPCKSCPSSGPYKYRALSNKRLRSHVVYGKKPEKKKVVENQKVLADS